MGLSKAQRRVLRYLRRGIEVTQVVCPPDCRSDYCDHWGSVQLYRGSYRVFAIQARTIYGLEARQLICLGQETYPHRCERVHLTPKGRAA